MTRSSRHPRASLCGRRALVTLALAGGVWLAPVHALAQGVGPTTSTSAEALIRQEQVRAAVAAAFDLFRRPAADGAAYLAEAQLASDLLVEIGSESVLYLTNELEQAQPDTFYFCAFTLGRIPIDTSRRALREAIERAEVESGDFAIFRKAWAAYGLAMTGEVDAIELLNDGVHRAAHAMIHRETSSLEAAAIQTAPESVGRLLALIPRYGADDELRGNLTWILRALRRLGDPSAAPAIAALLDDADAGGVRGEAARALAGLPGSDAVDALLRAAADADFRVRRAVAISLEELAPAAAAPVILERLPHEDDTVVRGFFYGTLARAADPADTSWVDASWGRPDPSDRRWLVGALSAMGDARADRLREAVVDPDIGVMSEAGRALVRLGDEASAKALSGAFATVPAARVVPLARVVLATASESTVAAVVARLGSDDLREAARRPAVREDVKWLLTALLDRAQPGVSAMLREWRASIEEPFLRDHLDRVLPQFERLDRRTRGLGPWIRTLESDVAEDRPLAIARLGRAGTPRAARALVAAFDRDAISGDERLRIVEAVTRTSHAAIAAPLLERILHDAEYATHEHRDLRAAAAWSARRFGETRFAEMLERAVDLRRGREVEGLVYLTLLDPARGAAAIERWQRERMHSFGRARGDEQLALARLRREARSGDPLRRWDRPPASLPLR